VAPASDDPECDHPLHDRTAEGFDVRGIAVSAFGVPVGVRADDDALMSSVERILPPGHVPIRRDLALTEFSLERGELGTFRISQDDRPLIAAAGLADAIDSLDARIRIFIATNAPRHVFVHAGVVAHRGRALLLPGPSGVGKTELVACLVRAGATYYSDEYAVLDPDGLVHPYPRPLSIRTRGTQDSLDVDVRQLGGEPGTRPAPVGLVAALHYDATSSWRPEARSAAAGVLLLLAHSGLARSHPERALLSIHRAMERARVLEGPRGEAEPAAEALLAEL
jgi:hypothetical protein